MWSLPRDRLVTVAASRRFQLCHRVLVVVAEFFRQARLREREQARRESKNCTREYIQPLYFFCVTNQVFHFLFVQLLLSKFEQTKRG